MKQNVYDHPEFFDKYTELRRTKVTYNDFIEQPAIKKLLPHVQNKRILDIGCGFGEFAWYCVEQGAEKVIGIDISHNMLSLAKPHPKIDYIHGAIEDTAFETGQLDLVVSSLAFHYIENYNQLIANIANWLKPCGTLIFSTEHPIVTANKEMIGWMKDENGNKLYYCLDHYGEEGIRLQHWNIEGVMKYHRKISTLVNVLIENGFILERIEEPESTEEGLRVMPKLKYEQRKPSFVLMKASKRSIHL